MSRFTLEGCIDGTSTEGSLTMDSVLSGTGTGKPSGQELTMTLDARVLMRVSFEEVKK
jgi:hypothetical protein